MLQCVAVCCSVLQGFAVCCSVLWSVADNFSKVRSGVVLTCDPDPFQRSWCSLLQCVAVCHCGAVCCSVLHCVAVCCSVLQCAGKFTVPIGYRVDFFFSVMIECSDRVL